MFLQSQGAYKSGHHTGIIPEGAKNLLGAVSLPKNYLGLQCTLRHRPNFKPDLQSVIAVVTLVVVHTTIVLVAVSTTAKDLLGK